MAAVYDDAATVAGYLVRDGTLAVFDNVGVVDGYFDNGEVKFANEIRRLGEAPRPPVVTKCRWPIQRVAIRFY